MIYEVLQAGIENATSSAELCRMFDISVKDVQTAVRRERKAGRPICATTGNSNEKAGYYKPKNRDEMQKYCRSLQHRAGEIYATRRACLIAMESLPEE